MGVKGRRSRRNGKIKKMKNKFSLASPLRHNKLQASGQVLKPYRDEF